MSSLNQPKHRRPSYAQTESSYRVIIRNKAAAAGRSPPGTDHGPAFSYYAKYENKFGIDETLKQSLPDELKEAVEDFKYSGAAICTALDRLDETYKKRKTAGYQAKLNGHLARSPDQAPVSSGAVSESTDSATASPEAMVDRFGSKLERQISPMAQLPPTVNQRYAEPTPPESRMDSGTSPTPVNPSKGTKSTPPDLQRINSQLSSSPPQFLKYRKDSLTPLGSPDFDEQGWEHYLNQYRVELEDVKVTCLGRFKGAGHRILQLSVEFGQDKGLAEVMMEFGMWWNGNKNLVAAYEQKVKDLPFPTKESMQAERVIEGLKI